MPHMHIMRVNNSLNLNRRSFLKLAALGLSSLAFRPLTSSQFLSAFSTGDQLGRVNVGMVDVKARPNIESQTIGTLYEDAVVPWLHELVGKNTFRTNQRWGESAAGFIWSPYLQPVRNNPNTPVGILPVVNGETGMWVEVSMPYVDMVMDNPPPRSPDLQDRQKLGLPRRVYYSQILWVDQLKTDDQGQIWYRVNERYGS